MLGRCHSCGAVYEWDGPPMLRDAYCGCGFPLAQTTPLMRTRVRRETPAAGERHTIRAEDLRRQARVRAGGRSRS